MIAKELESKSFKDSVMAAYIDNWWSNVNLEYILDETDKYEAYAKQLYLTGQIELYSLI